MFSKIVVNYTNVFMNMQIILSTNLLLIQYDHLIFQHVFFILEHVEFALILKRLVTIAAARAICLVGVADAVPPP